MIVRPWAAFTTDLPDDQVEDETGILIFPGRNIAEAIGEILLGLGADVKPPEHEFEHGWTAHLTFKGHGFWYQVSVLEPQVYVVVEDNAPLLSKKKPELYAELIAGLNAGLAADARVHELLWYSREDGPCFPPDGTGTKDPFASGPRRPRAPKSPSRKETPASLRSWPHFLAKVVGWLLLALGALAVLDPQSTDRWAGVFYLVLAALVLSAGYRVRRILGIPLPWVRREPK